MRTGKNKQVSHYSQARTGPSTLAAKKTTQFSLKKGLIVAGLIAIVGVVVVASSFAGGTPDYQYSIAEKCSGDQATQSCKDLSAEALVYRLYVGISGRQPNLDELADWTQKLAGDRVKPLSVIEVGLRNAAFTSLSNRAYIERLYQNFFRRPADAKGLEYWTKQLDTNKLTRGAVAIRLAQSNEAKRKAQEGMNTLLAQNNRPIVVRKTAAIQQSERALKSSRRLVSSTPSYNRIAEKVAEAKTREVAARNAARKNLASQKPEDILKKLNEVEAHGPFIASVIKAMQKDTNWHQKVESSFTATQKDYLASKELSAYATDIPYADITSTYREAKKQNDSSKASYAKMLTSIANIEKSARSIEKQYWAVLEKRGRTFARSKSLPLPSLPGGTKYWVDDTYSNKRIHVLKIDLTNPKVSLRASKPDERGITPTDFAKRVGAVAAINGDFFTPSQSFRATGPAVGQGVRWQNSYNRSDWSYLACTGSNSCIIDPQQSTAPPAGQYGTVVGGSPVLVEPGAGWYLKPGDNGCAPSCSEKAPRTAVGLSADKKTMWWVVAEGRQGSVSGLSLYDLAGVFKKLNAKWAVNLDGGGSTGMVLNKKLINRRPSGEQAERKVGNSLGIIIR